MRDTKVKTWARFKQIIADLNTAGLSFEKFQVDDTNGVYELVIQNSMAFTYYLEHSDATDKTDYDNNYKSGFIIINDSSD